MNPPSYVRVPILSSPTLPHWRSGASSPRGRSDRGPIPKPPLEDGAFLLELEEGPLEIADCVHHVLVALPQSDLDPGPALSLVLRGFQVGVNAVLSLNRFLGRCHGSESPERERCEESVASHGEQGVE